MLNQTTPLTRLDCHWTLCTLLLRLKFVSNGCVKVNLERTYIRRRPNFFNSERGGLPSRWMIQSGLFNGVGQCDDIRNYSFMCCFIPSEPEEIIENSSIQMRVNLGNAKGRMRESNTFDPTREAKG